MNILRGCCDKPLHHQMSAFLLLHFRHSLLQPMLQKILASFRSSSSLNFCLSGPLDQSFPCLEAPFFFSSPLGSSSSRPTPPRFYLFEKERGREHERRGQWDQQTLAECGAHRGILSQDLIPGPGNLKQKPRVCHVTEPPVPPLLFID